jgi:hypothetical protein
MFRRIRPSEWKLGFIYAQSRDEIRNLDLAANRAFLSATLRIKRVISFGVRRVVQIQSSPVLT